MQKTIEEKALIFAGWIINRFTQYKLEKIGGKFRIFESDLVKCPDPELLMLQTTRGVMADIVDRIMQNGAMTSEQKMDESGRHLDFQIGFYVLKQKQKQDD